MRFKLRSLHRYRKTIYLATILGAVLASMIAFFAAFVIGLSLPVPLPTFIILVVIGFAALPGAVDFSYGRWKKRVDDAIPRMLSDVTANVRTGVSLTRSLEVAAGGEYGPLTDELRQMKAQLSWGVTFEDAVKDLIRKVDTLLARRTFQLLLEADRAGGRLEDLLDAIRRHTVDLQNIEKERRSTMRPYVAIIYIAFAVFVAIAVLLVDSFFGGVVSAQKQLGASGGSIFAGLGSLDIQSIRSVFFQMALIEAIFGGLGAGKLGEGSFGAGFKHVVIMVVITVLVFSTVVT